MPRVQLETLRDLQALLTDEQWKSLKAGDAHVPILSRKSGDGRRLHIPSELTMRRVNGGMANLFATVSCYWHEWVNGVGSFGDLRVERVRVSLDEIWYIGSQSDLFQEDREDVQASESPE